MSDTQRNIGNPDAAQAIADAASEAKQEKEQNAAEAQSALQKISDRRSEKEVHVRIEGTRVPFAPPKGDLDELEDYFLDLAGVDEDDLSEEEKEQYRAGRDLTVELLAEKCKDPASSEEYWRSEFSNEERMEFLNDLAEGGEEGKSR